MKRHPPNFEPLTPQELAGGALLLGIDAEFVQHWPAEKVMQGSASCHVIIMIMTMITNNTNPKAVQHKLAPAMIVCAFHADSAHVIWPLTY